MSVDDLIAKHTAGIEAVQIEYSDEYPNGKAIADECRAQEVREILLRIENLATERELADKSGNANGDDLDHIWSKISRYASLLPHLVSSHTGVLIHGISSGSTELRLFTAQAFKLSPSADAVIALQTQLGIEKIGPVRVMIESALHNCTSRRSWFTRLLR